MKLSAVLIVKNEAHQLARTLAALDFVDEIVVCDSGSTDATLAIAARYGAQCVTYADWQGFGIQRQRAQSHASGDWILAVDADEVVSPALKQAIVSAVAANARDVAYALPRCSWCFGRFIRHGGWYPDYVVRLYARTRTGFNAALVHERLVIADGMTIRKLSGDLWHYPYRDLRHYLYKSADYADAWARMQPATRPMTIWHGVGHGIWCFLRMYVVRAGFLDGSSGLVLAMLSAQATFGKYIALWSHRRRRND